MIRFLLFLLITPAINGQVLINSYRFGCPTTAGNIYPSGTALSECTGEANAVTGWSGVNCTVASSSASKSEGTYSLLVSGTSTSSGRGEYTITVSNSTTYDVYFDYRVVENYGTNSGLNSWTGVTTTPNTTFTDDNAWHSTSVTVTTNSTSMLMRFYIARGSPSQSGGTMYIDNLRIVPQ